MLALEQIGVSFGERTLFEGVSHTVGPHDRIGLVGANGSGKSTLLKIVAGLAEPSAGRIARARYVTVGYLPQDAVASGDRPLAEEAETAFEDTVKVQGELEEARRRLEELDPAGGEYADTLEVFGELQHKLEDLDAFRMRSKVERVLMGLGFSVADFDRPCGEFSGGWQMRIALAKLLLREPSLLLLDEPTNHLDLDSLRWFEEYLRSYNGAVILVSHDRAFLDNLTTKTLAIALGRLAVYAGNYSYYERERGERRAQAEKTLKNQQKKAAETQKFVDRFRYKATKARQVQSRIKMLEKMEFAEVEGTEEEIAFRFPTPDPSGAVVMELRGVEKSYGPVRVFEGLDCRIERGERIAVVGPNGAGKSTFSRILAGAEQPDAGARVPGHNAVLSYFGQHQAEELDHTRTVLETVEAAAAGEIRPKLRTILGSFLFHGDDVFKRVSVLSGGEKSRLALARMLLRPANLLILDEPTNHLDMRSKSVLLNALLGYEGTVVVVSHDRAFLDPLVTRVIEFTPGRMRSFPGTVSEFLQKKDAEARAAAGGDRKRGGASGPGSRGPTSPEAGMSGQAGAGAASRSADRAARAAERGGAGTATTSAARPAGSRDTDNGPGDGADAGSRTRHDAETGAPLSQKDRKRLDAERRQRISREQRPWKEKLAAAEREIAELEARIAALEARMADPEFYRNAEEAKAAALEYPDAKRRLDWAYAEWERCTEEIERIGR